jgi:hypothetical protein
LQTACNDDEDFHAGIVRSGRMKGKTGSGNRRIGD